MRQLLLAEYETFDTNPSGNLKFVKRAATLTSYGGLEVKS